MFCVVLPFFLIHSSAKNFPLKVIMQKIYGKSFSYHKLFKIWKQLSIIFYTSGIIIFITSYPVKFFHSIPDFCFSGQSLMIDTLTSVTPTRQYPHVWKKKLKVSLLNINHYDYTSPCWEEKQSFRDFCKKYDT